MRPVLAALVVLTPKVKAVWEMATPRQPNPAIGRRSFASSLLAGSRIRSTPNIRRPPTVKRMATSSSGGMDWAAYLVAAKFRPQETAARTSGTSVSPLVLPLPSVMKADSTSPSRWSLQAPASAI